MLVLWSLIRNTLGQKETWFALEWGKLKRKRKTKTSLDRGKHWLHFLLSCWRQHLEFCLGRICRSQFPGVRVSQRLEGQPRTRDLARLQTQTLTLCLRIGRSYCLNGLNGDQRTVKNVGWSKKRFPVCVTWELTAWTLGCQFYQCLFS